MKALFCLILLCSFFISSTGSSLFKPKPDQEVRRTIETLFKGMREGDSTLVRSVFDPSARLMTVIEQDGKTVPHHASIDDFIKAVGTPHEAIWDERIGKYDVLIDGPLATAWTPYTFYLGDQFSHCGVNAFQLYRHETGWKIIQITDTRRKEGC